MLCAKGSRETSLDFYEDILGDKIGERDVSTTCLQILIDLALTPSAVFIKYSLSHSDSCSYVHIYNFLKVIFITFYETPRGGCLCDEAAADSSKAGEESIHNEGDLTLGAIARLG